MDVLPQEGGALLAGCFCPNKAKIRGVPSHKLVAGFLKVRFSGGPAIGFPP